MKKLLKTLTIMIAAIILTGCVKMNVKVVIEDEKSATMAMEAYYSKEFLDSYGADSDTAFEQFKTDKYKNWKTKEISKTIDGKEYIGMELIAPAEECKDILDNISVKEDGKSKIYTFDLSSSNLNDLDLGDTDSLESAGYSVEQMKKLGVEMSMSIQMPGKIESATFGEIDENIVTIDLLEIASEQVTDIEIVSKENTSANAMYLYLAAGVAVVAIVAVVIIMMKKKKKNPINSTEDNQNNVMEPTPANNQETAKTSNVEANNQDEEKPVEEPSQPLEESEENKE